MKATKKPAKKAAPAKKAPAKKAAPAKKPAAKPAAKQPVKVKVLTFAPDEVLTYKERCEDLQKELKKLNEMKTKLEGDKKELMKRCNEKDADLVKVRAENMNLKQKVRTMMSEAPAPVPPSLLPPSPTPSGTSIVASIKRSVPAKTNPFVDGIRPSCKR